MLVLVRGAGDLGTGVGHRLYRAGFDVILTELPEPRAVRRAVAFSEAVFKGRMAVEGVTAVLVGSAEEALWMVRSEGTAIPLVVDPEGRALATVAAPVLVDARMAKRNLGTRLGDARVVIGLGPGFTAGEDVHAVVETARGPHLGEVIYSGRALEFDGIPGKAAGFTLERVLRAPQAGILRTHAGLGSRVDAGQVVAEVAAMSEEAGTTRAAGVARSVTVKGTPEASVPVVSAIPGILRGLLRDGAPVTEGQKVGDVDPRGDPAAIGVISDKARAVAGGVLEAILCLLRGRPPAAGKA